MNSPNQPYNELSDEQGASSWPSDDQNQLSDDPTASLFSPDRNQTETLSQTPPYQSYSSIPSHNAKIQKPNPHPNSILTKRRSVTIPMSMIAHESHHHPYASTAQRELPFFSYGTNPSASHPLLPTYSSSGSLHVPSDALATFPHPLSTQNGPQLHHESDLSTTNPLESYYPTVPSTSKPIAALENNDSSTTNPIFGRPSNLLPASSTGLQNLFPTPEHPATVTTQASSLPTTSLPSIANGTIHPGFVHPQMHAPNQVMDKSPPTVSSISTTVAPQLHPPTYAANVPPFPIWPTRGMGEAYSHQPFPGYVSPYAQPGGVGYPSTPIANGNHPGNSSCSTFQTPDHSQGITTPPPPQPPPSPSPYYSPMYPHGGYGPISPIPAMHAMDSTRPGAVANGVGQPPIPGMISYYPYYGCVPGSWNYDPRNVNMWPPYEYAQPYPMSTNSAQPMIPKKKRLQWTPELHAKFVAAVEQAGVEQAVPKMLLQAMQVPGLTRENVASHLQKYREGIRKKQAREIQEQEKLLRSAAEHEHENKELDENDGDVGPSHAAKKCTPEREKRNLSTATNGNGRTDLNEINSADNEKFNVDATNSGELSLKEHEASSEENDSSDVHSYDNESES